MNIPTTNISTCLLVSKMVFKLSLLRSCLLLINMQISNLAMSLEQPGWIMETTNGFQVYYPQLSLASSQLKLSIQEK